jgi:hypothetical protein
MKDEYSILGDEPCVEHEGRDRLISGVNVLIWRQRLDGIPSLRGDMARSEAKALHGSLKHNFSPLSLCLGNARAGCVHQNTRHL